jgi:N-acetylglutamate synthase-like GNAT family acetyltransferase
VEIRAFETQDAQNVFSIIKECFEKIDLGRHTRRGVQIQLEGNSPEKLIEKSQRISYFVAIRNGKLIGICGHDHERIHTLFVKPDCHHEGIGGKLLDFVLAHAQSEGISEIRTWSTYFSVEFYRRYGFQATRDIYLPEGKNDIGLVEMVRTI